MGHQVRGWALAGGLAVEIHWLRAGRAAQVRPLGDLDFVALGLECAPESLAEDFLFRHVHPGSLPGKILLQLVDPESALRVDLFRACDTTLERSVALESMNGVERV